VTEVEWFAAQQPLHLLEYLQGKTSERKFRLFACICARRIWEVAEDCRGREVHAHVALTEAFADGNATLREMETARENGDWGVGEYSTYSCALYAAQATIRVDAVTAAMDAASCSEGGFALLAQGPLTDAIEIRRKAALAAQQSEHAVQAALIGDIFGNPFRPVTFEPAWRTSTAVALAAQMYEAREFSAMPILADALQDAGCDNDAVLTHCREVNATHVRGCWVVDLVLGKQ
jgi:hypothetical protein